MTRRRKTWIVIAILLALIAGFVLTSGPPRPRPTPPGTFSFAVLGDAPYYAWEGVQYQLVLRDLAAHDLRFVLHIGDIFWHPCSDEMYERSRDWFNELRHPVIYTPGDNEWADCWESGSGSFEPSERLVRLRQIFFANPTRSLGGQPLALVSQGRRAPYTEYVENARWTYEGFVFATVHLVGSRNGLKPFPGRTAADDSAAWRRTEAATAWMREAFAEARAMTARGVILGFHANPDFEGSVDDPYRIAYEPFLAALEEEVERFAKPVLAVQGDDHIYTVDHPLVRRTTGRRLENFTRMQVPGSPKVGWVRVVVSPGAAIPFAFEERVVPRWKYW